jgi:hypothetical protein
VAVYWQQQQALEGLKGCLVAGDWGGAEGAVEGLAPGLLGRCPALRFALLRCRFMKVGGGRGWVGDGLGGCLRVRSCGMFDRNLFTPPVMCEQLTHSIPRGCGRMRDTTI